MINCRALNEKSLFVTAAGDILPCCHIYQGGPNMTPELLHVIEDRTFESLAQSWNSNAPFRICKNTCDDRTVDNPRNISFFDKQWDIKQDRNI